MDENLTDTSSVLLAKQSGDGAGEGKVDEISVVEVS